MSMLGSLLLTLLPPRLRPFRMGDEGNVSVSIVSGTTRLGGLVGRFTEVVSSGLAGSSVRGL
jgi:hypothetical protein